MKFHVVLNAIISVYWHKSRIKWKAISLDYMAANYYFIWLECDTDAIFWTRWLVHAAQLHTHDYQYSLNEISFDYYYFNNQKNRIKNMATDFWCWRTNKPTAISCYLVDKTQSLIIIYKDTVGFFIYFGLLSRVWGVRYVRCCKRCLCVREWDDRERCPTGIYFPVKQKATRISKAEP